jgi:competence protein ComEA
MTPAERRALAFLVAVAAGGAAARAAGLGAAPAPVVTEDPAADARHALDRQLAAVDSARASRRPRAPRPRRPRPPAPRDSAPPSVTHPRSSAPPREAPSREAPPREAPAGPSPAAPLDVDRADAATLEQLPGVGPALARRIVADRARGGPFGSVDGLSRVAGIGPRLEARLRPLVTFSGRAPSAPSATPGVPRRPP